MKNLFRTLASLTLGVGALIAAPSEAASTNPTFTITSDYSLYAVALDGVYSADTPGYQYSYAYSAPSGLSTLQHRDTGFASPVASVAMIGLSDLGTPGSEHVFVGVNATAAVGLVGNDFDTAFGVSEAHIVDALLSTLSDYDSPYFGDLSTFQANLRRNGYYAPADLGALTLVAFSSGQVIGSALVTDDPAGVPEPAAWSLMIGGVGAAGGMLRRGRKVRAGAASVA